LRERDVCLCDVLLYILCMCLELQRCFPQMRHVSNKTPFAPFLLMRVRVRRVVFANHVFRIAERAATDAGLSGAFRGGAQSRFALLFREFLLFDGSSLRGANRERWFRVSSESKSSSRCKKRGGFEQNLSSTTASTNVSGVVVVRFGSSSRSESDSPRHRFVSSLLSLLSSSRRDREGRRRRQRRRRGRERGEHALLYICVRLNEFTEYDKQAPRARKVVPKV